MIFEDIYQAYWHKVYRLCNGYINDHDAALDLTQETFIKVWQQLPKFRNESSIATWIFRIATNTCLRQIANNNKVAKSDLPLEIMEEEVPENTDAAVKLLYRCIADLPEIDRIIISLELEEVPQEEIANIVGISKGNVRVKIHRIKDKLNQKFKQYEF